MRNEERADGQSVDPGDPFTLVRRTCDDLIKTLPKDHHRTVELLNAKDIAGGLLEALLGFPRRHTDEAISRLAKEILGRAAADGRMMLVVCMSSPSLEAWDRLEGWDSAHVKEKEFFVRLMENYHLAIVIGGLEAASADEQQALITSRIRRCLDAVRSSKSGDWNSRRDELREDVIALYERAGAVLGKELLASHCGSAVPNCHSHFLHIVARLDQFGKRPIAKVKDGIARDSVSIRMLKHYGDGSYGLRQALNRAIRKNGRGQLAPLRYLQAYEFFRDCARWLGDGAFPWARSWRSPKKKKGAPFKALLIDENLGSDRSSETRRLRTRLSEVFSLLFPEGRLELDLIHSAHGILPTPKEHAEIGDSIAEIDSFFEHVLPRRTCRVNNWRLKPNSRVPQWEFSKLAKKRPLRDYQVIFCEVDYRTRFAGPQIVQKLASYLERTATPDDRSMRPALIVLTHMDNIGHVQQCLNLGAHSYVVKERLYQVPSRLKRAIEDIQAVGNDDAMMRRERFGQHANFRALYSLRPDRTARLRHPDLKQRVVGGWMREEGVQADEAGSARRGDRRGIPVWDEQDRDWIRRLPKADLHCHFGTSISLATIEALAFNTCGHLFRNWTGVAHARELVPAQVEVVLDRICKIVLHAAAARSSPDRSQPSGQRTPAAEDYFHAMKRTLGREGAERIPDDPYAAIVDALTRDTRPPIREHMIVALLVAVTARLHEGIGSPIDEIRRPWSYFTQLSQWCKESQNGDGRRFWPKWIDDFVLPAARLGATGAEALRRSVGPLPDDHMSGQDIWARIRKPDADARTCEEFWATWHTNIDRRVRTAGNVIDGFLREAAANLGMPGLLKNKAPSLHELVVLPIHPSREDHRLRRYLWGCGLLGAEHLQYPENIILAAHDLVCQNIEDNVVYTEVRCETPGYARAGLSAEMATDLLCASFDLGTAFERAVNKRSFIRTNVLLAAKRHKKDHEIETVVSLLASYLRRSSEPGSFQDKTKVPAWWKPARVVGFDLSGDESQSPENLKRQIVRLIELSSPITIHAGEAASAESIWQAVYEYHARRIGHGLRLRERGQLLQFCINEGICMEMCPISNVFTSDFVQINWDDKPDADKPRVYAYDRHRIEHYPLRHFMESGLEVCINTDNRSLHGSYGGTLTDEYLWAARLSGSFTRWEVLKLIKAGFKHAFIDKSDAQELIQAVENWIFAQVANAPGLDWHPERRPDRRALGSSPPI